MMELPIYSRIRRYVLIAVACVLAAGCGKRQSVNTGPKSSVTYFNSFGQKTSAEYYNRNGDLVRHEIFDEDGKAGDIITYTYDGDNNLVAEYDSAAAVSTKYVYDDEGRRIREVETNTPAGADIASSYSADGSMRTDSMRTRGRVAITRLDARGNELEAWFLDEDRDTIGYSVSAYNERDLEVENKYYQQGTLMRHRKRVYDAKDNVTEESWYGPSGEMRMRYENRYDEYGRLLFSARYTGEGEDFRLEYEYKGNERYCTTRIPGLRTRTSREVYTYFEQAAK